LEVGNTIDFEILDWNSYPDRKNNKRNCLKSRTSVISSITKVKIYFDCR
jgi:hypothetical protein